MKALNEYNDKELYLMLTEDRRVAEKAFAELYSRHSSRIYAFCRKFIGSKEEAQDIFQETFIRFHQSADKKKDMSNVPAYLLTIARNLCLNHARREKPSVPFEEHMYEDRDDTNEKNELLSILNTAIDLLPEEFKEVFILREYDGLSYAEIAEITGEKLATVKIRIHRAKQRIKEIVSPYLEDGTKIEN